MVKPITLIELYERAETQGVEIIEVHTRKVEAAVFEDGFIFIDRTKLRSDVELKCALAHELGHWETASFYNVLTPYETWERCERKANKRAVEILMPLDDVRRALRRGYVTVWALAELFEVTQDFAQMAMDMYEADFIQDAEDEVARTITRMKLASGCMPQHKPLPPMMKASDLLKRREYGI